MSAARCLDGIHIPDQVGDRHVGGRKLLDEALVPSQPCEWSSTTALRQQFPRVLRDRSKGIIVHFASGDRRYSLVQQAHELSEYPALSLPSKPEKDEVVPGKQGIDDLR